MGAPGHRFTNELPWYVQRPAAPAKAEQGSLEVPAEEPFGLSSWESLQAVYQVLHEEMQEELDSDRHFFIENPTAPTWYAPPSPWKRGYSARKRTHRRGRAPSPTARWPSWVKELAPGLRLRLRLPPCMADGWKSVQSPDLFAILDEERSQHMWERCTGE